MHEKTAIDHNLTNERVHSIDILRGIVMVLMTLDHVRDYFGVGNPSDLVHGSVPLFLTRWITDFCAPVFFLLTGTSAFLAGNRRSRAELSKFLFTRGLWLIFLELTFLRCLAWQFNFDYHVTVLSVIWALGWAMVALAGLVRLHVKMITAFGLILIFMHNLLDRTRFASPLWTILHAPGFLRHSPHNEVFVAYPLIPWMGVTALGYSLGSFYQRTGAARRKLLSRAGLAASALFIAIRLANGYGDPQQWSPQQTVMTTVCSFLDATKYPPSLDFLLMTLGPAALILVLLERPMPTFFEPTRTIGKVPLFYYVLHIVVIHIIAVSYTLRRYGTASWMFRSMRVADYPVSRPPGWGLPLLGIYAIWVAVVAALYPLCRWFAGVKQRRTSALLSYF